MTGRTTLHILAPSSRLRSAVAQTGFALGHHCEVYADIAELAVRPPAEGIMLVRDEEAGRGVSGLLERLPTLGIGLPVVAFAPKPSRTRIVAAIRGGALDYLAEPVDGPALDRSIATLLPEIDAYTEARRRMIEARERIANLSPRERDVLDRLAEGIGNKGIAEALAISPRTVEIHRSNMMAKLGADHAAGAVRMRLESGL